MDKVDIQNFVDKNIRSGNEYVKISFKKRSPIFGLFVKDHKDYSELKSKNFWRIVPRSQFDDYLKSGNVQLAKIFNGSEFLRLAISKDLVEV